MVIFYLLLLLAASLVTPATAEITALTIRDAAGNPLANVSASGIVDGSDATGDGCSFYYETNCIPSKGSYFERLPIKHNVDQKLLSYRCDINAYACDTPGGSYSGPCTGCKSIGGGQCNPRGSASCWVK